MTACIVIEPKKGNNTSVYSVTDSLEEAKESAKRLQSKFLQKGWESWANKIKIPSPKTREDAQKLANELVQKENMIDMANMGGTYRGDGQYIALMRMERNYHWAQVLRQVY